MSRNFSVTPSLKIKASGASLKAADVPSVWSMSPDEFASSPLSSPQTQGAGSDKLVRKILMNSTAECARSATEALDGSSVQGTRWKQACKFRWMM
mmetsp:Transcript_8251/g.15100  ORF Transcript_8251/g.15100 Transcript_8251/m.15100 type:complete len:95 (+) Transcript_8251:34-318(+)